MKVFVAAAVLIVSSAPAYAKALQCRWTEKQQCDPGRGCKAIPPGTISVKLDPQTREYSRCDSKGCDTYQANVNSSGLFKVYELPGRGVFAKVALDGQATEVVSLMNSILVSQGRCR